MLGIFDGLREFTFLSILIRVGVTFLSASVIGFERARGGRAAGLRTHILVGLGACIVMITNQYLTLYVSPYADPARLGAQVINGIGFLGAGTILVMGKRRVTGLTTAAGLWTTACVGLAYGGGYFEGGIVVTAAMVVVMVILHKVEGRDSGMVRMKLLVEFEGAEYIPCLLEMVREQGGSVRNISIDDEMEEEEKAGRVQATLSLRVGPAFDSAKVLEQLSKKVPVTVFREV